MSIQLLVISYLLGLFVIGTAICAHEYFNAPVRPCAYAAGIGSAMIAWPVLWVVLSFGRAMP
jgi:hypothetical protein